MNVSLSFCSWNVRGLADLNKCDKILSELLALNPEMVLHQETKLQAIDGFKLHSFLPRKFVTSRFVPAVGASGGILSAASSSLQFISMSSSRFSLSMTFSTLASTVPIMITNIYAPTDHDLKPLFLNELRDIQPTDDMPWLLIGDFNLIRSPEDKNNQNFSHAIASALMT